MRRPALVLASLVMVATSALAGVSNQLVDFAGYHGCPSLQNDTTRIILCPQCGGRILSYSFQGQEAIPLNPAQDGYTWQEGQGTVDPYGGRFDVGPETRTERHLDLWLGPWRARFTAPGEVVMVSPLDGRLALQLIRTIRLSPTGSHLRCTQKIINRSKWTQRVCHWSRTFAQGKGIALVPLNPASRFPRGYLTYGPGSVMDYAPKETENVQVRGAFLEISGNPPFSKFVLDTEPGQLAYLMRNGIAFVKKWPVYPRRSYAEMSAATLSLYYYPFLDELTKKPEERPLPIDFCELEPIGPTEMLAPGQASSFSEDWWLQSFAFPAEGTDVDLAAVRKMLDDSR